MTAGDPSFGDVHITQFGNKNIGQQFVQGDSQDDPLDRLPSDAMSDFIRAVAQSLAALELSKTGLDDATQALEEIRAEASQPTPGYPRLRSLAITLRRVVEETAGHVLGGVLLGSWHP